MPRQSPPIDRKLMREINQNTLLNLIRSHAPISRTQLKELSGLSLGTIVGITSILIDHQFVVETGTAESTGGRKPGLLEIFPEGGYAVGISLKEYEIAGSILNLNGAIVCVEAWEAPLRDHPENAVEIIAQGVEAFIGRCGIPREKIIGLGCGVSGPVNARRGISVDSSILHWHNVELGKPLTERLKIPVFVDNAVNCLASFERLYGMGQRFSDFLVVTLGRGLGMAAVIRGDLFRGAHGLGAEFGHIPFERNNGRRCECGNLGCLEEYVADRGMATTYRELSGRTLEMSGEVPEQAIVELYRRAQQGDEAAYETFRRTGTYLGTGLALLINLFNPQGIIMYGGEMVNRYECMEETMQAAMNEYIFSQLGKELELIVDTNSTMVNWARGAGCLVLRDFFALPTQM